MDLPESEHETEAEGGQGARWENDGLMPFRDIARAIGVHHSVVQKDYQSAMRKLAREWSRQHG